MKEDERKEIFDTFWSYGDLIKCRQAICNTIEVKAKERSRGSGTKNRQSSIVYKLNGKRVCKTMFLNTYSISERFVRTCVDKLDDAGVQEDITGESLVTTAIAQKQLRRLRTTLKVSQ